MKFGEEERFGLGTVVGEFVYELVEGIVGGHDAGLVFGAVGPVFWIVVTHEAGSPE